MSFPPALVMLNASSNELNKDVMAVVSALEFGVTLSIGVTCKILSFTFTISEFLRTLETVKINLIHD